MSTGEIDIALDTSGVAASAPRIVLFDFDGVLFCGDAFYLFIKERYATAFWRKLLALLTLPWLLLCLPFSRKLAMRTLIHVGLFGMGPQRYQLTVEAFADQLVRRPRQFYRDSLLRLRKHQAEGDKVIVVTGCERLLVSRVLAQLGLTDLDILATELKPGWSGMRVRAHNIGRRKVQRLAADGITRCRVAYSDSLQDLPMLKLADEPVVVNGTPNLCKRVEKGLARTVARVAWY